MNATSEVTHEAISKAQSWLTVAVDEQTRTAVQHLLDGEPNQLLEAFHSDLEFGTGGLRGVMGVGTMRMNRYTVGMATQGLANYIDNQQSDKTKAVAIAYDSRINSLYFAQTAAAVLSANGITVYMFGELRPTPLLSFAVRQLHCIAGIVITASHNPKEYNGYKVYWEDGAQVLPPHDRGIIAEVRNVPGIGGVKFDALPSRIHHISDEVENEYLRQLSTIIHAKEEIKQATALKVVYTSIHGAGITMVPRALADARFSQVYVVREQATPDGNFSTVSSPNPEEKEALNLALKLAEEMQADLVLGTDPDADRVGVAVRNSEGLMTLLNGNQAACLIVHYQLMQWKKKGMLNGKQYIAKTIVTTNLLEEIAKSFGVKCYDTLTGFKYIAGVIREKEGTETFIAGGEESYGYSVGEFVRDKDAVLSSVVLAEIAAWCCVNGTTMWQMLMDIYAQHGLYHETLVSVTMKGLDGAEKIKAMMVALRATPPVTLGGVPVAQVWDISTGEITNKHTGEVSKLQLPASNVLQFLLDDGSKISARPSGTEPKIKFYFSLKGPLQSAEHYATQVQTMNVRIAQIQSDLGLNV
ncbi:MAG: phospho-sugar mutase [Flavobacteriales bacterium]